MYGGEKKGICGGSIIDLHHICSQSLEYHKLTKEHCKERSDGENGKWGGHK